MQATLMRQKSAGVTGVIWDDGRFGYDGEKSSDGQPPEPSARDSNVGLDVRFWGRLDNRREVLQRIRCASDATDAALIAACYTDHGENALAELRGDFAVAIYDPGRRRLVLARDPVGIEPLYYAKLPDGLAFASNLRALLRIVGSDRAQPRPGAVVQLLCAPQALAADETFFEGLRALPPAHLLVYSDRRLVVRKYWSARGDEYARIGFDECVEEFRTLFRQSIRRRVMGPERPAVLVSGGLDSASIYCCAREVRPDTVGIYHGASDGSVADETRYIARLEELGQPLERVALLPAGYPEGIAGSVGESESPLADDFPLLSHRLHDCYSQLGVGVVLNGAWADQTLFPFPPGYLRDAIRAGRWTHAARHVAAYPHWFTDVPRRTLWFAVARGLLAPGLRRWLRRARRPAGIARLFSNELQTAQQLDAAPIDPWSDRQTEHGAAVARSLRSRYDTLTMDWYAKSAALNGYASALPFLDQDLLTLLVTAPGIVQTRNGTPKALIREALRGIVPQPILERRSKGDYTALAEQELAGAANEVFEQVRRGPAMSRGWLDPQPFSHNLAYWCSQLHIGRDEAPRWLGALFAVDCWLHVFFRD